MKAKFGDMAYQDFYLGQVESDGWGTFRKFVLLLPDCINYPGDCVPDDLIIITEPQKGLYSNLINNPSQFLSIFEDNRILLEEDIHPTLVNGVLDNFFKLEVVVNNETNVNYFNFIRIHDEVLVGTYPIIID